jgi:Uma2 family endonuclease
MSTQSKTFLTRERYLEIERQEEWKNEYYRGEIIPMPLPGFVHCEIVGNVGSMLSTQLRGRDARALMSALKVFVPQVSFYAYPDISIFRGRPQFQDLTYSDTALNPTVIVEIFTKRSEEYDRGLKFDLYRYLPSLSEYLLVSAYDVSAELFTRQPDDQWLHTEKKALQESVDLRSIDCRLPLAEVYERVDFNFSQPGRVVR